MDIQTELYVRASGRCCFFSYQTSRDLRLALI
uniref:Uncharacterized protein n=1 Tax=Anguilla anguilla TaxID=7936 RepID=A0A0E9T8T9_ANGAN